MFNTCGLHCITLLWTDNGISKSYQNFINKSHTSCCWSPQVSRLILLSGGSPNARTEYLGGAPLLCVAARCGFPDMVSLLLEFGADPNATSRDSGTAALGHAASAGHLEVMRLLSRQNARVSQPVSLCLSGS